MVQPYQYWTFSYKVKYLSGQPKRYTTGPFRTQRLEVNLTLGQERLDSDKLEACDYVWHTSCAITVSSSLCCQFPWKLLLVAMALAHHQDKVWLYCVTSLTRCDKAYYKQVFYICNVAQYMLYNKILLCYLGFLSNAIITYASMLISDITKSSSS